MLLPRRRQALHPAGKPRLQRPISLDDAKTAADKQSCPAANAPRHNSYVRRIEWSPSRCFSPPELSTGGVRFCCIAHEPPPRTSARARDRTFPWRFRVVAAIIALATWTCLVPRFAALRADVVVKRNRRVHRAGARVDNMGAMREQNCGSNRRHDPDLPHEGLLEGGNP